jgi:histidyl-tRNA synthetase
MPSLGRLCSIIARTTPAVFSGLRLNKSPFESVQVYISFSTISNLGLKNITLEINTLGSNEARANYRSVLVDYFTQHKDQLDEDLFIKMER